MNILDTTEYKHEELVLIEEVNYFHNLMFSYLPNKKIVDAYCKVHYDKRLFAKQNPRELATIASIISNDLDAIAIEPWLRREKIRHPLTTKLLLISYLAECDGTHLTFFRAIPIGLKAFVKIPFLIGIAGFRLTRGYYQKVRYELV